jgi:hypothetical protein
LRDCFLICLLPLLLLLSSDCMYVCMYMYMYAVVEHVTLRMPLFMQPPWLSKLQLYDASRGNMTSAVQCCAIASDAAANTHYSCVCRNDNHVKYQVCCVQCYVHVLCMSTVFRPPSIQRHSCMHTRVYIYMCMHMYVRDGNSVRNTGACCVA